MTTKTATKTAATKTAKTAAKTKGETVTKTAAVAAPFALAAYVVAAVQSRIDAKKRPFYKSALAYHKAKGTTFPRHADYMTLDQKTVDDVMRRHDSGILAAGAGDGQRVFDIYMVNRKADK